VLIVVLCTEKSTFLHAHRVIFSTVCIVVRRIDVMTAYLYTVITAIQIYVQNVYSSQT